MKTSLAKVSFYNILITALIFSIVLGFFTYKITNDSYESRVAELEKNYMEKNKKLVKNEVLRVMKRMQTVKKLAYDAHISILEEKVNYVENVINHGFYDDIKIESLINKYREELDLFKWDNHTGYFFIFNQEGKVLYHGAKKEMEGKNLFDLSKDNDELIKFLNKSLNKDTNLGSYHWFKPNEGRNELYEKHVFIKRHLGYKIYIAAGVYKDELDKKIQSILFKEIEQDKFGDNNYGYFWIHSYEKNVKMLMHPYTKTIVGKDITDFKTLDGQYLFQNMNKIVEENGGGYINYIWWRPNLEQKKQDEKTSYVHLLKDWNIVLGSGFYLTELREMLDSERDKLRESLNENLQKILTVLGMLILISLVVARYFSKKIQNVELAQKEQYNMLEQYKQVLDKSAVVSKTDKKGVITYINKSFSNVSGYSKEEVLGKLHNVVRHPDTPKSQFKKLWNNIQTGSVWNGILKNKRKDGESYYTRATILPIKDSDGNILEYISAATDITELVENRSKLQSIFRTDTLTGLGSRVSLIDDISKVKKGGLIIINIDRFKEINDTYGHKIGDSVIKEFANRLFNFFSDEDYKLYRVQADVFALYSSQTKKDIYNKVNSFMKTLGKEIYQVENKKFIITYTAGMAFESENLFTYADIALNEAKRKNVKIKEYDSSMKNIEEFKNNIEWVEKLHQAISEDKIVPFFQPIYNYHTKKIEKYECLMRMIDGDKVIPPGEYLSIAKKTRVYPELTYKMVEKAIGKFATNTKEFSINLSVEDLMNDELMIFIYDYADQKEIFNRMVLEVVESEEIEDSDHIIKTIKRFKDRGAKVAIDDFGSGYSNYDYLISLQADYVKIDGSIVNHLLDDERTQDVVKSIVDFAKKSNMKTIAEFVSSKELDEIVEKLGVDYAQGYYYGKAEQELKGIVEVHNYHI